MKQKIKKFIKNNRFTSNLISFFLNKRSRFENRQQTSWDTFYSNIIEGNLVVTLNNIYGKFEMDVRSHILKRILISKVYEPEIVDLVSKNIDPSKDAINIGANIGLFTNLIAYELNFNNKVLAIEPTPSAFKLLEANIERNGNSIKVLTYNGIATDKIGNYNINIIPGNEEYSSIGEMVHQSVKNKKHISIEVKGETIDNLVLRNNLNPGIIVMDVEGAEFHVLTGAIETLKKYHPTIIMELDDNLLCKQNSNSKQVIKFLENLKYNIIDSESNILDFPFTGNIVAKFKN